MLLQLPESIEADPIHLKIMVDQLAENLQYSAAQKQEQVVVDLLLVLQFAQA